MTEYTANAIKSSPETTMKWLQEAELRYARADRLFNGIGKNDNSEPTWHMRASHERQQAIAAGQIAAVRAIVWTS
jgi:hypothetical protein